MANDPTISVALVTRNRPDILALTLKSVRAQSVQPYEFVVSDDSNDEIAPGVRKIADQFDCVYTRGPRSGLYGNRNNAALACRGSHIRTMDDDHEFPDGHFDTCADAVGSEPETVWVIGEYSVLSEVPQAGQYKAPICPAQLNARGYGTRPENPKNCWAIADGSTIYPRSVFDSGARYADDFTFGASYLEFGSLLNHLGYTIRQLESTFIIHHVEYGVTDNVWRGPSETEKASRFFAMLCHDFTYRPSLGNKAVACTEIVKQTILRGGFTIRAVKKGIQAWERRKDHVAQITLPKDAAILKQEAQALR